jgi:hypothetical protein
VVVVHAIVEAQRDDPGRRLAAVGALGELADRDDLEPGPEEEAKLCAEGLRSHTEEARIDAHARGANSVVEQDC